MANFPRIAVVDTARLLIEIQNLLNNILSELQDQSRLLEAIAKPEATDG